jgi:hypothetical protein
VTDDLRVLLLRRLVEVFDSLPATRDDEHGETLRALRHLVVHRGEAGEDPMAQEVSEMLDEIDAGSLGSPEAVYLRLLVNPRAVAQTLARASLDSSDREPRAASSRAPVDNASIDGRKLGPRFNASATSSLLNELRALCRGQGVRAPDIDRQVGPALREVCGIDLSDGPEAVRAKLSHWVTGIVNQFSPELRLAVLVPLGLQENAWARFLSDRVDWLSQILNQSPRTTRRRIETGLTQLVEAATDSADAPGLENGWRLAKFGFRRSLLVCCDLRKYGAADEQLQRILQELGIQSLDRAGAAAGVDRSTWIRQPKGDEEFAVLPPDTPERPVVDDYLRALNTELRSVNRYRIPDAKVRMRLAIHHGAIVDGANGFPGSDAVLVSRLLDSKATHLALEAFPNANLVVMLSEHLYQTLVAAGHTSLKPTDFRKVEVTVKNFTGFGWMWIPDGDVHALDLSEAETGTEIDLDTPDRTGGVNQHAVVSGGSLVYRVIALSG